MDETAAVATIEDPTVEEITGATYGALKALCEQEAEAAFPGRATIVRPGLIVGPGDPTDRFTYWPVRVDRGGEVMAPGVYALPPESRIQDVIEIAGGVTERANIQTLNKTSSAAQAYVSISVRLSVGDRVQPFR